ncbi:VWA domain-containing protein [uncultured Ruegeria sp.]|uniref:vWA domain-containing protein n=1 Tax=uncultured Ruegeria sp. TaxID=259304 RepID=UPI00260CAB53|nr:VWA domain-containing protein [uncultured Ruegeria sp.]
MTDDLDDLKQMLNAATPSIDPAVKKDHLALARKNFTDLQESRDDARQMSNRPNRGFWTGAFAMLNIITSRAALTATTVFVVVGVSVVNFSDLERMKIPNPDVSVPELSEQDVATPHNFEFSPNSESPAKSADAEDAAAQNAVPNQKIDRGESQQRAGGTAGLIGHTTPPLMESRAGARGDLSFAEPELLPSEVDRETYANEAPNRLQITSESPVSTFSIDVDTASYAVIRNSLMNGQMPNPDAVRIEEMINYFPYDYPAPHEAAFKPTVTVSTTPWNPDTRLVHIGIQGALPDAEERAPLNLVFLIDTSGSMNQPNKLPLLKQSIRLMLGQLRPSDQVSIVTYAGSAGQVLAPTNASERAVILTALDQLDAGGSTAGQAGLQQAYSTAEDMTQEGEITRVILATDGDFNVGMSDPDALKNYIADKRDSSIYLSVLGFGRGNLQDTTMQALAQNGNGQAAYIDTLAEAQKVLVDQLTGALFPIADDVKIQVEFNPAKIVEYRLIGYETRALRREDFNNDAVDAGDIGAGHTVTALYEVTPTGSPAQLSTPMRYQARALDSGNDELGFLALRYKAPGAVNSQLIETPITMDLVPLSDSEFATAIAGFGQLLRGSDYTGDWSYEDAIELANEAKGDDPFGYRAEAVQLMRLAASLAEN